MAWGMINNPAEKTELEPTKDDPWYQFLQASLVLDKGDPNKVGVEKGEKPYGWHWFWGIYHLHNKIDTFPRFNSEIIQIALPDGHKFKKEKSHVATRYDLYSGQGILTNLKERLIAIKDPKEIKKIDFSGTVFKDDADFSNLIFPINTNFSDTKFLKDAIFTDAIFFDTADFENAEFHKKATFCKKVFYCTKMIFRKKIALRKRVTLCKRITFCIKVALRKRTDSYKKTAKFRNTTFNKIANFRNVKFWKYANFKGAIFGGRTDFQKAKFKSNAPRFYGATFNNEMTWAGIKLPKFGITEDDYFEKFANKVKRVGCIKIIKNRSKRIEENQNSYENTSILLGNEKKYHDQHFFFRQEMRCRRRRLEHLLTRPFYWFYEIFSNYGYGIGHAFFWWVAHICAWTAILFFYVFKGKCVFYERLSCSFLTSLSNAHSFFLSKSERLTGCSAMMKDKTLFDLIWAFETIFGAMFLFLLLTTFRVRFRINNTK